MTFKVKDHFYKKAKNENFLARSVYKLEEIDARYKVLKKGDLVLDLGYYPGSWVQYTASLVGPTGIVVGIDIKPVDQRLSNLENVKVFQKDINDIKDLSELGVHSLFDVVLSDMAPNTTGMRSVDQDRSLNLVEMIFYHLPQFLKPGGNLVVKVFESQKAQDYLKAQKSQFLEYNFLRPKSTRSVSKEYFLIAQGYKGPSHP
ncbi:MAG: SAM-dependent methyltransferase [Bacteriovoracaceae bacterium]